MIFFCLHLWDLEESPGSCFAQNKTSLLLFKFSLIQLTDSAKKPFIGVQKTYYSDLRPRGSDAVYLRLIWILQGGSSVPRMPLFHICSMSQVVVLSVLLTVVYDSRKEAASAMTVLWVPRIAYLCVSTNILWKIRYLDSFNLAGPAAPINPKPRRPSDIVWGPVERFLHLV